MIEVPLDAHSTAVVAHFYRTVLVGIRPNDPDEYPGVKRDVAPSQARALAAALIWAADEAERTQG